VSISAEALAATCAWLADERKADNIVVLNVGQVTTIADYFVIATGRNPRHLKALLERTMEGLKELGAQTLGIEGEAESGWVLIDAVDVIIHLFTAQTRSLYDLEMLWGACPSLDWAAQKPLIAREPMGL